MRYLHRTIPQRARSPILGYPYGGTRVTTAMTYCAEVRIGGALVSEPRVRNRRRGEASGIKECDHMVLRR